jgi:hypothetical protein
MGFRNSIFGVLLVAVVLLGAFQTLAANPLEADRQITGVVVTDKNETLQKMLVIVKGTTFERETQTGENGQFSISVPTGDVTLSVVGPYVAPNEKILRHDDLLADVRLSVRISIPPIHQNVVIVANALQPTVDTYNADVFRKTLFSRDDQLLDTLGAGINAAQHEGGGKSLEVRRFGFNTDHGGANGGLKILVDNVQQNQGTQGHGQGYLGALKSLTPELVEEVQMVNGPFSPEYGDFSGLGVVHIRLRESLQDRATLRLQGGSFGSVRTFMAYSPDAERTDAFIAYEGSRTDGPFDHPLEYKRDNITGNYTKHFSRSRDLAFKSNFGRNDFSSSGQIPLDLVASGDLSRFGAIDPSNGGRVRLGTVGVYYRHALEEGASFKLDGFASRSLFDLYSNFTMFLNDPIHGDGIQQHDSRHQEGFNTQYLRPFRFANHEALLTAGTNYHDNEINVGLFPAENRVPRGVSTLGHARVTNVAGYLQQNLTLLGNRVHFEAGVRWDYFRFRLNNQVMTTQSGVESAAKIQPKVGVAYSPSKRLPFMLSFNYGRGINTQDARGVVENPLSPRIATTDFYQAAISWNASRVSIVSSTFLIERSNEQVYIPDDGSVEPSGPSRSYGYEGKMSVRINRYVAVDGGLTQIVNSFYRATTPRLYVDSAPHTVANGGLTLTAWQNMFASLRWRHVGNYRLDGGNASLRASGLDVLDLAITKTLRHWLDINVDFDNLTGKDYYETQNFFQSRTSPGATSIERIHGTPGYPFGVTIGLTFRLGEK